jgi:3-deoxy-D-manno-octulosonic-acid transferase
MRPLLWSLFWFVAVPLVRLLDLALFWHPRVRERNRFEKRNKFERLAHSFAETAEAADLCFEFSSEGELQQVAPLIDDALAAGKKIELVFFSPSVEKGVMALAAANPRQIRYLRYPFVRILPFVARRCFTHWVTAKTLVMVRYDLFPELLLWGMARGNTLTLVWMTFKKERSRGRGPSWWKRRFLAAARTVVYAGDPDGALGKELRVPGPVFDFRIEQIRRRVERRGEKFRIQFPVHGALCDLARSHRRALILGNAWPSDLFLLRDLAADVFVLLVPHDLSLAVLDEFQDRLRALGRDPFVIGAETVALAPRATVLLNRKGLLCELYADFGHAYVGGSFEGSIHSILEPLVAGSPRLACGPAHHRSTEFDVAAAVGRVTEVTTPEAFRGWLERDAEPAGHDRIEALSADYKAMRELVISC